MPSTARSYDINGWPEIKRNPISRVGVFPYLGKSIDPSLEPNKIYMVYRPQEELSDPECIESFKLLPWVDLHPGKLLGSESAGRMPAEKKGVEGVTGQDVEFDPRDGILYSNIKIFSDSLGEKIDDYGIRELSIGYGCRYEISDGVWNGQPYQVIQRKLRGNHLASVPEGRSGSDIAVLDHQLTFTMDAKDITMPNEMTEEEKKMKECSDRAAKDGFKRYSKDAEEEEKEKKDKEEKEAADKMAKDKAAKDADEKEKDGDTEAKDKMAKDKMAKDKAAKDAEEEKKKDDEKKEGMDAAIVELRSELQSVKKDGIKAMLKEVNARNELYGKVSEFVGAFDCSVMTTEEVAQYGIEKLGLKCPKGTEQVALDSFFHGRKATAGSDVGYALDNSDAGAGRMTAAELFSKPAQTA